MESADVVVLYHYRLFIGLLCQRHHLCLQFHNVIIWHYGVAWSHSKLYQTGETLWFMPNENGAIYLSRRGVAFGISSALSIVGMWMLAQKWWQQWFCWMIVEPLMVVLFWMGGNYASALLYVIYEVFCVLGLISWRRRAMKEGLGEPEDTVRMSKL